MPFHYKTSVLNPCTMSESGTATITFNLPSQHERPRFLCIKQIAQMLGYSYKQTWTIVMADDGPPLLRLADRRDIRIPYDEFMHWLNSKRIR